MMFSLQIMLNILIVNLYRDMLGKYAFCTSVINEALKMKNGLIHIAINN